ncbi:MAG TPA: MFS transporter, partial [Solirubrobacteraceae bacterium]|nr:MFS transporter [Solirubrobacteraceae bacterium]
MTSATANEQTANEPTVIETDVPARLDRLPWARFHWLILLGLGTVWILDGIEVTIVGNIASRLSEKGAGIHLSASQIGTAAAFYVAGACLGALFFGQLTDRFGRKRLFMLTMAVYLTATTVTAFSFAPWFFFVARFFTGAGIGGEYAAINSAIDELIPARVRGRVDLVVNGTYWAGAAVGALTTLLLLDERIFPADIGWRLAFVLGAALGFGILLVRRHVPESPRWLFIHGRDEEAEKLVGDIERAVAEETGQRLDEPEGTIEVRQRETIGLGTIAATAFRRYPKRTVLGLALFLGQAFLYNAVTFNLGGTLTTFFKVASGSVPVFFAIFAVSNLLGPLTLGRLFDTVGRKPMITLCYLTSAALCVLTAILLSGGGLTRWSFLALIVATFFFASAGASAAYLTVSEIFPMETRALAIAFFYAVGTAAGGIAGPLLFGRLIATGDATQAAIGYVVGAAVMACGGVAELALGVKAEGAALEDVAKPLTAEEAEGEGAGEP